MFFVCLPGALKEGHYWRFPVNVGEVMPDDLRACPSDLVLDGQKLQKDKAVSEKGKVKISHIEESKTPGEVAVQASWQSQP